MKNLVCLKLVLPLILFCEKMRKFSNKSVHSCHEEPRLTKVGPNKINIKVS